MTKVFDYYCETDYFATSQLSSSGFPNILRSWGTLQLITVLCKAFLEADTNVYCICYNHITWIRGGKVRLTTAVLTFVWVSTRKSRLLSITSNEQWTHSTYSSEYRPLRSMVVIVLVFSTSSSICSALESSLTVQGTRIRIMGRRLSA